MRRSIFTKLTASFFFFSMAIIGFMWIISSSVLDREFQSYLVEVNLSEVEETFEEIAEMYSSEAGFSAEEIRDIRRISNRRGYFIDILNQDGESLLDSIAGKGGFQGEKALEGELEKQEFPLEMEGGTGTVTIAFRDVLSLKTEDMVFKSAMRKSLGFAGMFLLLLSIVISYFFSRKISTPIRRVKLVAERIKDGEWSQKYSSPKSDPKEIYELSESIDRMASTLKAQEDMRKQLVSDMAHELRTPIAVLKSHLEAMIEGIWDPSVERLEDLYAEADMVNELVDRLKDIHTLESGSQALNLEAVDLAGELVSVASPLVPMFEEKGIELEVKADSGIKVKLDKSKFKQIMYNLILNAYKYSGDGAKVTVEVLETESGLELSVSDTGIGISGEDLPLVFERFYRGEKSRNKEYGGTGLGLTIVKALVEAHGWNISAESKLGRGSKFTIAISRKSFANS